MDLKKMRAKEYIFVPVIDKDNKLKFLINTAEERVNVAASALIMAGGKGERLLPHTKNIFKILLMEYKPIIEYNVDRLISANEGSKGIPDKIIKL